MIKDSVKVDKINNFAAIEKGTYDATLVNGDKATVHIMESSGVPGNKFTVCAFMPDDTSLAVITSTLAKNRMDALLKSMKIIATEEPTSNEVTSNGYSTYSASSYPDSSEKTVHVSGYYRKDGTYVKSYNRRPSSK
jgi:hypothetical protein